MTVFLRKATAFWNDEGGASGIEYGLIAALIAAVIVGVVGQIGDKLLATFETLEASLP